ncbi:hypothetical protein Ancab_033093 [Ancistrocladus abbreviatus]
MGSKQGDPHAAARNGDLNAVESILFSNPLAINSRDKHSRTPLHLAAWAGHSRIVSFLCKHKADVGAAAIDDMAAIHFAAQKGHLEVVKTLVSSGVSVKASNRKGMTALHYAAQGSHLELAKYLMKKGANLTAKTKAGKTPLDLAGNEETRALLLECESINKGDDQTGKRKAVEEEKDDDQPEAKGAENEEEDHKKDSKRKDHEDDGRESPQEKTKKTKVALSHLLTSDDTQEDDEDQ